MVSDTKRPDRSTYAITCGSAIQSPGRPRTVTCSTGVDALTSLVSGGGCDQQRAHGPPAVDAGSGCGEPAPQCLGRPGPGGMIEMVGQVGERDFEVDHNVTSSPSVVRSWSSARERRDFAVPSGQSSTSA